MSYTLYPPLCKLRSCHDSSTRCLSNTKEFWTPHVVIFFSFKITCFAIILHTWAVWEQAALPIKKPLWMLISALLGRKILHRTCRPAQLIQCSCHTLQGLGTLTAQAKPGEQVRLRDATRAAVPQLRRFRCRAVVLMHGTPYRPVFHQPTKTAQKVSNASVLTQVTSLTARFCSGSHSYLGLKS